MWLADHLEATGPFRALWVDLETAREKPDVVRAMTAILAAFDRALAWRHPELPRPSSAEVDAMLAKPDGGKPPVNPIWRTHGRTGSPDG